MAKKKNKRPSKNYQMKPKDEQQDNKPTAAKKYNQQEKGVINSKTSRWMLTAGLVIVLGMTTFGIMEIQTGMMIGSFFLGAIILINSYYYLKEGRKNEAIFLGSSGVFIILLAIYVLLNIFFS